MIRAKRRRWVSHTDGYTWHDCFLVHIEVHNSKAVIATAATDVVGGMTLETISFSDVRMFPRTEIPLFNKGGLSGS